MPRLSALLAGLWILPSLAAAQDRPFVFSLSTSRDATTRQVRVDSELAARDYALRATFACRV